MALQLTGLRVVAWEDPIAKVQMSALHFKYDPEDDSEIIAMTGRDNVAAIRLTNVAEPTHPLDAASKAYVDAKIQGMSVRAPVRVVTVDDVADLATGLAAGAAVDGVTLAAGDRVLVAGQTDAVANGVYVVTAAGAPERAADMVAGASASGSYVFVDAGDVYADRSFVCTSDRGADAVGTDPLEWVQFGARPTALAGFGLKVGAANALDVDTAVVPALELDQTFTGLNTFGAAVTVAAGDLTVTAGTVHAPHVTGLNAAAIVGDTDAVSVEYLRAAIQNGAEAAPAKAPVRAAPLANANLTTLQPGATVDGVTLVADDRVLLFHQTDPKENGLYVITPARAAARAPDMPVGSAAHGVLITVLEGNLHGQRLLLCTSEAGLDTVGSHNLTFVPVAQPVAALAGAALAADPLTLRLGVRTDGVTLEVDPEASANHLRLKDAGVTNAKLADATIENAKLAHPQVHVKAMRGLKRTTTDGAVTSPAVTDPSDNPADLGLAVPLGGNVGLELDFTVLPDLSQDNVFAGNNTFTGTNAFERTVTVSDATNATSQTTGALVVTGGVGVSGDVFCTSTYFMSDARLKDNVCPIPDALDRVRRLRGCTFEWNARSAHPAGTPSVGVIAQDVQAVAPLAVTHNADTDLLAVDYGRLVPYLIEAVKALSDRCQRLDDRLAALAH